MDRLSKIILFIGVVSLLSLHSCQHDSGGFIYLEDVLGNRVKSLQQRGDLVAFLYLEPDLLDTVVILYPTLLTPRQREPKYFEIDVQDQVKLKLEKEYASVEQVIENLEPVIIRLLKEKYSINTLSNDLSERIPVYKNKAFVEFFGSAIQALIFEYEEEKNELTVGFAYSVVD